MRATALMTEKEEQAAFPGRPHLSHSRINRYLTCPEQYRLYYVEGLRPRLPSANLVFGKIIHEALARLFRAGEDPETTFAQLWDEVNKLDLSYSRKDTWEKLKATGQALLSKFLKDEYPKLNAVEASEKDFELEITSLDLPFVGIIDLVAFLKGRRTVVDFKTAASGYEDHEVALTDQLTAYQMAEPEAEQAALCILVKTKEPRIEWHLSSRSAEDLTEYLEKAAYVAREIATAQFYKRPGKWCSWCDFLPVCLRDQKKIQETLVHSL